MEYVPFGRTGVKISRLALGTMTFGAEADEATTQRLYARCREAGINVFDCADVYAKGRSEELLGKLVAPERDRVVLTSKAYFPTGPDVNARGSSRYHLVRAVEASLRRLRTDYLDVFFLHRFDELTALDETLRAVDDLVRQGKVLYLGVSNFAAWQVMKAEGLAARDRLTRIVVLQPMYNLLKRQAEVELLPMARSEGLAVLPYSPLAGGLLTGKYADGAAKGRLRDNRMYQVRYGAPSYADTVAGLVALAAELGVSATALAIAWVAAHPAVTAPLLGARSVEQLEDALKASELAMTPELYARVAALSAEPPPATDRNEEKSAHSYGQR
jgi:aryl-alcohol dehydrogenase-like predicted oxidoreductase